MAKYVGGVSTTVDGKQTRIPYPSRYTDKADVPAILQDRSLAMFEELNRRIDMLSQEFRRYSVVVMHNITLPASSSVTVSIPHKLQRWMPANSATPLDGNGSFVPVAPEMVFLEAAFVNQLSPDSHVFLRLASKTDTAISVAAYNTDPRIKESYMSIYALLFTSTQSVR